MSATLKVLGRGSVATGTTTQLLSAPGNQVPAATKYQISLIMVAYTSGATAPLFTIHHIPSGGSQNEDNMIWRLNPSLNTYGSAQVGQGLVMEAGDKLDLQMDIGIGDVTATVYGVEIA